MIKTMRLKVGGAPVGFGGLQTQPGALEDDSSEGASIQVYDSSDGDSKQSTVRTVGAALAAAAAGVVMPDIARGLVGVVAEGHGGSSPMPHDVFDDFVDSKRKLQPMEQLSGTVKDRPEIVALVPFQPAFIDPSANLSVELSGLRGRGKVSRLTPVGQFIDAQRHVRRMRRATATNVVTSAMKKSGALRLELTKRADHVNAELDALSDASAFMLNVVKTSEKLRGQLDLRDDAHIVNPQQVFAQHVVTLKTQAVKHALESAFKVHGAYAPASYSVSDVMQRLGYDRDTVLDTFSSTKIWLQMLQDFKHVLQHHSLEFADMPMTQRRRDSSATVVGKPANVKHFGINSTLHGLPILAQIGSEEELVDMPALITRIEAGFKVLYEGMHFSSEETRIAALVHLVAQEHRYSSGLSQADTRRVLHDGFGYDTRADRENSGLFDAVIGVPGTTITDVPTQGPQSLVALAHRQVGDDAVVLTFESRYLDGVMGTFTPGSAYHVDSVLDVGPKGFSLERLDELSSSMRSALDRFTRVLVGMDLLATGRPLDDPGALAGSSADATTSNSVALYDNIVGRVVDVKSGQLRAEVRIDPVSVVYAHARDDTRLRALLFLLTFARLSQVPDGSVFQLLNEAFGTSKPKVVNFLIDQIVARLRSKTPNVKAFVYSDSSDNLVIDTLKNALRTGSPAVKLVEKIVGTVLTAFMTKDRAVVDGRTRYGVVQDTAIMMATFDIVCAAFHAYGGRKIVGEADALPGTQFVSYCFTLSVAKDQNHLSRVVESRSRLQHEVALVGQLTCTVVTVLASLASSASKLADFLRSPAAIKELGRITSVVSPGDRLRALFTEQQIMMLGSSVADLIALARRKNPDVDGSGDTTGDEEIIFLDDADATPQTAAEVEGAFGDPEFTLSRGYNKRILSIGVPHGMAERMKQVVDLRTIKRGAFRTRQADMVMLVIHKVDVQMSDIVFVPQRFMFELSRFPVRDSSRHLPLPVRPTLRDVIASIPTRDFGSSTGVSMTYPDPRDVGVTSAQATRASAFTFSDADHAFLTRGERRELLRNHALSYLAEVYVKLLTGTSLAEHHFELDEQEHVVGQALMRQLVEARAAHVNDVMLARPSLMSTVDDDALLFTSHTVMPQKRVDHRPSAGPAQRIVPDAMGADARTVLTCDAKTLAGFGRSLTTAAGPLVVSRRLLAPKQFDRVFSVIVDPDEFMIDEAATTRTPFGRRALETLVKQGEVISVPTSHAATVLMAQTSSREPMRLRSRDRGAGDMAFERYFVTIEPAYGTR